MLVYLKDGSALTRFRAATLRQVAGQTFYLPQSQYTVQALTLERQAPGRVATGVPSVTGMTRPGKFRRKRGSNPGSSSLEADALRVDTVVETKLALKLVKTTGLCSTVHGKFLIVLDFLVTTTSTGITASKGTRNLYPLSNKSLVN